MGEVVLSLLVVDDAVGGVGVGDVHPSSVLPFP